MLVKLFLALAVAVQLAVAFPTYKIPKAMLKFALANSNCILPEAFVVDKFQIWTPAASNNRTDNIFFEYSDNSTSIETKCHFNETSVNVGPVGLAPRYACENNIVTFIWQNEALTMIEKACPNGSMSRSFEASGLVRPKLDVCGMTPRNTTIGEGNFCVANPGRLAARFTSLQPTPE
ncbi:hypothetical protein N0V88_004050 [Collariella sp. IMI 366227]|nr:hypothetical protein N0V88_004050 [Collariella sp. IMI 366227]